MSRAVSFAKIIEKILPSETVWLNLEDEVVSSILSTGKKKISSTVGSKALFQGHVYDTQALSNLLEKTIKDGSGLAVALPVGCSPVQKELFSLVIKDQPGWGKKVLVDRSQALKTWTSYSSKQDNGLIIYLQASYSEVISFEKNKIELAERFSWGIDNWVKKIQDYYLETKQSLIPASQVEKIIKTFPVGEVLTESKTRKLSVRAQDQQTKSTVTLSINSQELAGIYGVLINDLNKKLRRCFGNSLGQVSGVVVVSPKIINGLEDLIQQEFGWDWSGQSNSGYEVVVGMKLLAGKA